MLEHPIFTSMHKYPNGEQGTPSYGYVLDQSESQASVRSLSDVLDGGGSEKTYDHCSIFVDNGSRAGNKCFVNLVDLKNAVDKYVSSGCGSTGETACPDIASTYGWPMNSWCVGNVADMSELFSVNRNPFPRWCCPRSVPTGSTPPCCNNIILLSYNMYLYRFCYI